MKQKWLELAARFDALGRRERIMAALGLLLGCGFLGYSLLIEPQLIRQTALTKRIAQMTSELTATEAQLVVVQAKLKDPDAINRAALQQGRKELAALDTKLRGLENSMVPPEKMQAFLESLLSKNRNLELLALRTLPPTTLIERVAGAPEGAGSGAAVVLPKEGARKGEKASDTKPVAAVAPNIYKHGVEIRIAGRYNDLLQYLAEIERMPQRIMWNRLALVAEQYPRNVLTLTVYTLSLDKQWLVV